MKRLILMILALILGISVLYCDKFFVSNQPLPEPEALEKPKKIEPVKPSKPPEPNPDEKLKEMLEFPKLDIRKDIDLSPLDSKEYKFR